MPPPLGGSSGGLPSRLEYLSPQGVLVPRVYSAIASPLWLELRGLSCAVSQATWHLFTGVHARCAVCAVSLATWLLFTGVPGPCVVLCMRCPWPLGSCSPVCPLGVLCVRCPWPLGSCSPVCPLGVLCGVCGVLGHLAPVHRCSRSVCCVACEVSLATWLLFIGVPARCAVCAVSLAT